MRLTRTRRTAVTLSATGVLLASVSWGIFGVAAGSATADVALGQAATLAVTQSCQPLTAATAAPTTAAPTTAAPTTAAPTTAAPTTAAPTTAAPTTAAPTPTVTVTQTITVTPSPAASTSTSAAVTSLVNGGSVHTANLTAKIAAAQGGAKAATVAVELCIAVTALQPSSAPGQPAQWSVAAWATGGNVSGAAIALQASPAGTGTPQFSFGCGSGDGTSTCSLGTVDAGSAQRQLQAKLTVPATATATAITLTATGSATGLVTGPAASAPVTVSASAAPISGATLPVGGTVPGGTVPGATISPGGSAATLFPTLAPTGASASITGGARQVASTSTPTSGNTHVGVELAGLFALAAAFVLAVTRVSVRRPPAAGQGGGSGTAPLPPVTDQPPSSGAGGTE